MEDDELVAALDDEESPPDNELDRIDPQPDYLTLSCGIEVHVLPLRTRQLFKLLRIITHGAGPALQSAGLDFTEDASVFMQKLISIVVFSIPDAEQETIDFMQSMVEPADLVDKRPQELTKAEREHNIAQWTELNTELWNPEPDDTLSLVENIVRREAKDIQALGKRISGFLKLASKTGQLKEEQSPAATSSESSPASSMPSPASTGGRTRRSSTSRSAGSDKSPVPSTRASRKRSASAAP